MAIWDLALNDLQCIQSYLWLGHFEPLLENIGVLVLDHQELSVRFVLDDLLKYPEMVDRAEEIAPREISNGRGRDL